ERTLIDFYPGRSGDGMCIDAEGDLYVAAGLHHRRGTSETRDTRPGIHMISPAGELLAFRQTPEDTITNCTFGGEDLQTLYYYVRCPAAQHPDADSGCSVLSTTAVAQQP
ncbi:MAG: SMP-30/gluconolactonase/LRE family protein, partial [Bacteroidetes bacterium]|nr:SMP-30/gluconolactonase/LRE family protein [Bacteroidota bacterium]